MAPPRGKHYVAKHNQCIDVMREIASAEEFRGYCRLNAIKYLWRMGRKDGTTPAQDARKAEDYCRWLAESLERTENG